MSSCAKQEPAPEEPEPFKALELAGQGWASCSGAAAGPCLHNEGGTSPSGMLGFPGDGA